jgi:universal stress protein F
MPREQRTEDEQAGGPAEGEEGAEEGVGSRSSRVQVEGSREHQIRLGEPVKEPCRPEASRRRSPFGTGRVSSRAQREAITMHRILVGLDASPRAKNVLDAALDLAQRTKSQLILMRAIGIPVEVPPEAYVLPPSSLEDLLRKEAQRYIEKEAERVPKELLAGTRVAVGTPWQAVCEAAKQENVDLIIIGSHGYQGLDRLIGTTAAKVVNHADRSVLVVRDAQRLTS